MDTNGKDTTVGNKRDNSAHHLLPDVSAEGDPTAAVTANTSPKQSKWVAGGCLPAATQTNLGHPCPSCWTNKLSNDLQLPDGLKRAEEAMLEALLCQAGAEQTKYDRSSSKDKGYPDPQSTSTIKLLEDHRIFLNALLPPYLRFGRGVLSCNYCPCSGSMCS